MKSIQTCPNKAQLTLRCYHLWRSALSTSSGGRGCRTERNKRPTIARSLPRLLGLTTLRLTGCAARSAMTQAMTTTGMSGNSYVRLRGLPFAATEQEVAQWFASAPGAPLSVLRVSFTYNTAGRKSGEAVRQLPLGHPRAGLRPCAASQPDAAARRLANSISRFYSIMSYPHTTSCPASLPLRHLTCCINSGRL